MTDITALDRAVNEANAKVAETLDNLDAARGQAVGGWEIELVLARQARKEALAARAAADKPKPLSAEEAMRLYDASCGPLAVEHPKAVQAVLDAAAERWRVVIDHALDAQFPGGGNSHERAMRETIRSILRGGSR